MSNINIKRAVENIRSGTTVYTPVIELIVNAIQAIEKSGIENGVVKIEIIRSGQDDIIDKLRDVDGFVVSDNGIGFNDRNRDSFDTLYTEEKQHEGGKGFGRFTCLKYFEKFEVESVYEFESSFKFRKFKMGRENDIIVGEENGISQNTKVGSKIRIHGIKSVKFPDKNIDLISRVIVEKLLPYFIDNVKKCPIIHIQDEGDTNTIILNDYLSLADKCQIIELKTDNDKLTFEVNDEDLTFSVRIFKFYSPRTKTSKISLVAHRREVTEVAIHTYIPEFAEEFFDKNEGEDDSKSKNYVLKAYVFGNYLDANVSLERGAFNFQKDNDLLLGISQTQIEAAAANVAKEAIGVEINARTERKKQRIEDYVTSEAPWHRLTMNEADFSLLSMNPSKQEIELHLQKAKFEKESKTRADLKQILANPNIENLKEKTAEVVRSISESSKNDLIHYVSMRKCVLDLFASSLELDENGKYKSEADVHDIIIPRRKDSEELDYEQQNLWILDERLNFTTYYSSDKPLNGGKSGRTDLTIFHKRIAFRGENQPSNPITIFEFKKPQRDDFANPSSEEDPIQQIIRYVNDIRDGKYKTPKGRDILVNDNTSFYGYVVCDLNQKVKNWLHREKNFTEMPDGQGWFDWQNNIRLYVEVLSWDKILRDAEMRNRIFFDKLGI